jgi:hypothetical protein
MNFYMDIDPSTSKAVLNTEETGIGRVLENARSYLLNGVEFWRLIGSRKAEQLERMLKEEIRLPPGKESLTLTRSQVERLVGLLQGIEKEAAGTIMGSNYQVLPGKLEQVKANPRKLVTLTKDASGAPCYVIDKLTEVEWVCAYLETALKLGCAVLYA